MGKEDYVLRRLGTIGEVIKYSAANNYLYACVEPDHDCIDMSALNVINALKPATITISALDDQVYLELKVKID